MKVRIYKALWGDAELNATEQDMARIRAAGYDGVEFGVPGVAAEEWNRWLETYELSYIGQAFAADKSEIRPQLAQLAPYAPSKINLQGGRDKMTFDEGRSFIEEALRAADEFGISVAHETHRHRLLYAPWSTAQYLQAFPELRLCVDFSHWCCVCESLLADMEPWVDLACERAIHIHGRVGYEEGPQVPDPRAPEFARHVARHEDFWDRVRAAHERRQEPQLSFTPEYGPPNYMHTLPYTQQPIANLWDVCLWGAQRLRERWSC